MLSRILTACSLVIVLCGCGGPGVIADPVEVDGKIALATGAPLKDVVLTLQPTDGGHMAGFLLRSDGSFAGKAIPGKYAYFFTAKDAETSIAKKTNETALKVVPEKLRAADLGRLIVVPASGGTLVIRME